MALIELAKKKGGRPVEFILYRRVIAYDTCHDQIDSIKLEAASATEAIEKYWPWNEKGGGKSFPGHDSDGWQQTTLWLDHVAAGGGAYERYGYGGYENGEWVERFGSWARVPSGPSPWRSRRPKKRLQFGNLAHITLKHQVRLRDLENQRTRLEDTLSDLKSWDEEGVDWYVEECNEVAHAAVQKQIDKLAREIDVANATIRCVNEEMRAKVRRMFPTPAGKTPKRRIREILTSRSSVFA